MSDSILYNALLNLSYKVFDLTIKYKQEGKLIKIPYQKIPVKQIDYFEEIYYYDWDKIDYFDIYEWKSEDLTHFVYKELSVLQEFKNVLQEIVTVYNFPEDSVKNHGLFPFLILIVKDIPNNKINKNNFSYFIELFIKDFDSYKNKNTISWDIEIWLTNISIESEEIVLADGVFLKRPKAEQLNYVSQKWVHSKFDEITGNSIISSAILTFSLQTKRPSPFDRYQETIIQEIESWLNIFRLFRLGNIFVAYQSIKPFSIFEYQFSEKKEIPQDKFWQGKIDSRDTSNYKYCIKKVEEELLLKFILKLKPILDKFSNKTYLKGNSYDLALHRYNDALLKSEVNAYKVLSSISSLEALLSDGGTELNYKMKLRVAGLLRFFNFNTIEVFNLIGIAYDLRSKLVHGSEPVRKNAKGKETLDLIEWARDNAHEIVNYNRICLIIFLQLKSLYFKDNIITLLNHSFINEEKSNELKKLIENNVDIPIVYPFVRKEIN